MNVAGYSSDLPGHAASHHNTHCSPIALMARLSRYRATSGSPDVVMLDAAIVAITSRLTGSCAGAAEDRRPDRYYRLTHPEAQSRRRSIAQ